LRVLRGCRWPLSSQGRIIVNGFRESVLGGRGKAVVQPSPQLYLSGFAGRISVRGQEGKSGRTRGAGICSPNWKTVGQELLLAPRSLCAEIGCRQLQGAGQVALHRQLPVLGVANAEIWINRKSIRRDRGTGFESIGQRERAGCTVLHAQTFRERRL